MGRGQLKPLGKLGAVNAIAGSFIVAFSAGFTVFWMTKMKIPVSTSQAIVGAIIGWNLFSGLPTDQNSLIKILSTWILCPLIAALVAAVLYLSIRWTLRNITFHILRMDVYNRIGLILIGAFGSYSLGANNIANVMGVFVPIAPFDDLDIFGLFTLNGAQQLFFIGGIAISIGVYTYSHKVMQTVGKDLMKISPETALIVVFTQALVLFLFASQGLGILAYIS